jgi:hypothetical protein
MHSSAHGSKKQLRERWSKQIDELIEKLDEENPLVKEARDAKAKLLNK